MATIKVRVNGEIATNLTPEVRLVCQNDKYDVEFEFDESWSNSNFKTALFIYNGKSIAVPFDREQNGNVCKIPALYETELLHIGVKSSDVEGLHTSTPARVGCLLSASDIANGEIPNPTPSQYDEIISLLNQYITGGGSGEGVDLRDYQKKVDERLETESKEIIGAINELHNREDKQGLTEEQVREIVQETAVTEESDPTVPDWAKQEEKPTYTYGEITEKPDLVEDIGSSLAEETNVLTIELKDKSGKVIASTEVAIPKGEVPDLSAYVKNTDYATESKAGVVKQYYNKWTSGIDFSNDGTIKIAKAENGDINAKVSETMPIVPKNLDYAVKVGITTNTETLTDEEKANACDWLGAVKSTTGTYKVYGRGFSDAEYVWSVGYGANANSIMMRNGQGRSKVKDPIDAEDIANKQYVDGLIAKLKEDNNLV